MKLLKTIALGTILGLGIFGASSCSQEDNQSPCPSNLSYSWDLKKENGVPPSSPTNWTIDCSSITFIKGTFSVSRTFTYSIIDSTLLLEDGTKYKVIFVSQDSLSVFYFDSDLSPSEADTTYAELVK